MLAPRTRVLSAMAPPVPSTLTAPQTPAPMASVSVVLSTKTKVVMGTFAAAILTARITTASTDSAPSAATQCWASTATRTLASMIGTAPQGLVSIISATCAQIITKGGFAVALPA